MNLKLIRTKPGTDQRRIWMHIFNSVQRRVIYRLKDEQVAQWSDVVSIPVAGKK